MDLLKSVQLKTWFSACVTCFYFSGIQESIMELTKTERALAIESFSFPAVLIGSICGI